MFRRVFRKLFGAPRRRPIRRVLPRVTELERRDVPSGGGGGGYVGGTFTWTGAADHKTWENAGNWNPPPGATDAWPGITGTGDNVKIGVTADNIITNSNLCLGFLDIAFGTMAGSLTINHAQMSNGVDCHGYVSLALGSGSLKNNDILVCDDGASDNTWTSGDILGATGFILVTNKSGLTIQRATEDASAPSPGKLEHSITVGSQGKSSDTSSLTIGNLNRNIVDDVNNEIITVLQGAKMSVNTSAASPNKLMGATDNTLRAWIDLWGILYRDCGTATGATAFTLGYALELHPNLDGSGGPLEIFDDPNADTADELDFSNWITAGDGTVCSVWNAGGSIILGQAPGPNRSGTATLGVTAKGLYQTAGHLQTNGTHTEEIDTGANSVLLAGGDMTFSADNPQNIGNLNVYGNFEFGAGSTWNWYASTDGQGYNKLNVYQVNGGQGNVKVDPGVMGGKGAPSIVCNAPAGMRFSNVIWAQGTVTDNNPTNFKLSNGFSGNWSGVSFVINS